MSIWSKGESLGWRRARDFDFAQNLVRHFLCVVEVIDREKRTLEVRALLSISALKSVMNRVANSFVSV